MINVVVFCLIFGSKVFSVSDMRLVLVLSLMICGEVDGVLLMKLKCFGFW